MVLPDDLVDLSFYAVELICFEAAVQPIVKPQLLERNCRTLLIHTHTQNLQTLIY